MKTDEETQQIVDLAQTVEDAVVDAFVKMHKQRSVCIKYHEEEEYFSVTIKYRPATATEFYVNVMADSVQTSIKELIREIMIYVADQGDY